MGAATRNKYRQSINTLCNWAVAQEILTYLYCPTCCLPHPHAFPKYNTLFGGCKSFYHNNLRIFYYFEKVFAGVRKSRNNKSTINKIDICVEKHCFRIDNTASRRRKYISVQKYSCIANPVSRNIFRLKKFQHRKMFSYQDYFSIENNFSRQKNVAAIYRAINGATKDYWTTEDCRMLTRAVKIRDVLRILGAFCNENRGRAAGTRRGGGHIFLLSSQIPRFPPLTIDN